MPASHVHAAFRLRRPSAAAVLAFLLASPAIAIASRPMPPLQRTPVLDTTLPGMPHVGYVTGTRVGFAPGQPTPLHRHTVPVVGVVTAGSFVFQPEGQPARTLRTGDAFYEPANSRIAHFDNASATAPAEITAFYLADQADQPLIELLDPPTPE